MNVLEIVVLEVCPLRRFLLMNHGAYCIATTVKEDVKST